MENINCGHLYSATRSFLRRKQNILYLNILYLCNTIVIPVYNQNNMKKTFKWLAFMALISGACVLSACSDSNDNPIIPESVYDENRPVGWASVDGVTTGSNGQNPVTVTTREDLRAALSVCQGCVSARHMCITVCSHVLAMSIVLVRAIRIITSR